ncbi:DUF7507 domain-containing protein [Streptomyces sp. NPDC002640]
MLEGIAVRDDRFGRVVCPATTLEPGETVTCTGTYVVTSGDARQGRITNTAVATAEGGIRSETDSATVQVERKPCHGHGPGKPCKDKPGHHGHGAQPATPCRNERPAA